jgi:tetratricopeptide (TPR) repeat protein
MTQSESSDLDLLAERLADEMRRRWRAGDRPRAEDYLAGHPELGAVPGAAAELIYEEICLREEAGQPVASSEIRRRFPQWSAELHALLDCHRALEADGAEPVFPTPGEPVGEFVPVAELGRGAQGRVYLATQPALADRPVVLKLTPLAGGEHLTLARLQHTGIVPLYSAADDPARRLRVLCMPYFGGATLAALLARLADRPPTDRTGADLLAVLDDAQAGLPVVVQARGTVRAWLARAGYVEAVCWVAAALADALHYAHHRDLLHLDLKPSNVLVAADGQPMLLDFHLARTPVAAGTPAPGWLGGTPAYMSPEQRAAMAAVRDGRPVPAAVDGRSDVYSLGLVLAEALAGSPSAADLRARNPRVSVGLADLVARCQAPDPADRYPDAGALADDLRRHLADQPLRGVANRDLGERWRKWRRRRPLAPWLLGLGLGLLAAAAAVAVYTGQRLTQARAALAEGRDELQNQRFVEARAAFRVGLALVEGLPFGGDLARELTAETGAAERSEAAGELHRTTEHVRSLLGAEDLPPDDLWTLGRLCRDYWGGRSQITARLGDDLPPGLRRQVRMDLLDLAILWSDLVVRLAPPAQAAAARRQALAVLADAEAAFGPSPALAQERLGHAEALGLADVAAGARAAAAANPPRTAWEHFTLGCVFLRAGDLDRAAAELDRAVDLEPQNLWANYYKGRCAARRGKPDEAVPAFTACIALMPDNARFFHSRGLAAAALGRPGPALRDFDRALQLDPGLAAARLDRGLLHAREGRPAPALADLRTALAGGASPAQAYYGMAVAHLADRDRAAARDCLTRALQHDPAHAAARALLDTLGPAHDR